MQFKQKLAYMALGSLFTLAGYLLASIVGDVRAQNQNIETLKDALAQETAQEMETLKNALAQEEFNKNLKVTELEAIRCRSLELVDRNGKVQGKIWVDGTWGRAIFPVMRCEELDVVEKWNEPARGGNTLASLGYTDSFRQDIIRVFNQKAVTTLPTGVEYPVTDDIVQIGADDTGGYVKVFPNRKKDAGLWKGGDTRAATMKIGEKGGLIGTLGDQGTAQMIVNEYGGSVSVFGKGSNESRAGMGVNEYGNGFVSTWDKNGYRMK